MRVGIIGSRGFDDLKALQKRVSEFKTLYGTIDTIVTTDCPEQGPDKLIRDNIADFGCDLEVIFNSWDTDKNQSLVESLDFLLLVWNGESKGSRLALSFAVQNKIPIFALLY